jgi:cytosine deaminase
MKALGEGSGGVGACLVDERNGKVVERGHNSQYTPYFRSDLHAEMDLLNRYEDRLKRKGGGGSTTNPRRADHMVLISSVEPCPMCLTRIINSGIEKMYYIIDDPDGGMVSRLSALPPFWRQQLRGRDYRKASCSPEVQSMSRELFDHSMAKTMARMKRRATIE